MANELELKEEVETARPELKRYAIKTAREERVVMMQVPSAEMENSHRIQVQVVGVDVKSAEVVVDSVLNVGVTGHEDVIEVCHESETHEASAAEGTEQEPIHREEMVTVHRVVEHVEERGSVQRRIQQEEQEAGKNPAENEPDAAENQRDKEEISRSISLDETRLDATLDLKEHKACEEDKEVETLKEEAETSPATGSKTGSKVAENAGKSSSTLQLEFESEIEFRQEEAPEDQQPINAQTQRGEGPGRAVRAEVALQATEKTRADKDASVERAVIRNRPVLLDVSVQPEEETKSTQEGTAHVEEGERNHPGIRAGFDLHLCEESEEEHEQDLWMDAEEDLCSEEESDTSDVHVEEPVKPQTEEAELQWKFEMAPESSTPRTTEEESREETQRTLETSETENDEEFAVAAEHLGRASASSRRLFD